MRQRTRWQILVTKDIIGTKMQDSTIIQQRH